MTEPIIEETRNAIDVVWALTAYLDDSKPVDRHDKQQAERLYHRVDAMLKALPRDPIVIPQKQLDELTRTIEQLRADNAQLRLMFAVCYSGMKLYRDDGELQDSSEQPFIDFRRDSVEEIDRKVTERAANWAKRPEIQDALRRRLTDG